MNNKFKKQEGIDLWSSITRGNDTWERAFGYQA